ncbi:MAG: RDD family protein [Acidimicrobiales bacterium]
MTAAPDDPGAGSGGPPSFPGNAPPPPPGEPPAPTAQPPAGTAGPGGPGVGPPTFPAQAQGGYPPPGSPEQPFGETYATWGIRVGGYLIDFVIFLVVLVVLYVLFRHSHALNVHLMARRGARRRNFSAVPFLITGVLYIAYGTLLCGAPRGQTVGMMAVGVRAVRDESFAVLGYGRAFARAVFEGVLRLINLLFFLLGLIWILDMLFPLWDRKRQTLHDKVAGSVVLRVRPAG